MMTSKALYIHVPFCAHICAYCDFAHVGYQSSLVNQWLEALQTEIASRTIPKDLKTLYLGGGTPVSLREEELKKLLTLLDPYCQGVEEYTIEINPEVMTLEKAKICAKHGVNRASIGFQSSNEVLLKLMGRKHNYAKVQETIAFLKEVGITNFSLDLMYSLPNQSMELLQQSVQDALALKPTHLSLYSLTIEPNTVFARKGLKPAEAELEADMYEWLCAYLPSQGYEQYEIASFAKKGFPSKHNQVYWQYEDFIGLSCGASGKENHERYDKPRSLKAYLKNPLAKKSIPLSKEDEMFESIMMGLRLRKGIHLRHWQDCYKENLLEYYKEAVKKHVDNGNLIMEEAFIHCTKQGFPVLQSILVDFL
ncbi:radical SAM family heme chaperone HemW [Bulleidia sp. zg-1006]|uniref:radical SAM family heme chaperone HemW n=1 Tax=Bulleidia sp. zg-1006 TaxID=2806552 RepID=UPI001EEE3F0A|nr:radical SAM family heme chaperone HemW [Bulleidia sp. zg-1006]